MTLKLNRLCALVIASLFVVGCTSGKRPFLLVSMCLSNSQGIEDFVQELRSIASAEGLEFVDNSRNAEHELNALGDADGKREGNGRLIDIRVMRKDGMAIGATNLGLPGYQVAMGFSEGSSATEAQNFANRSLSRIKEHWSVQAVPDGEGVKPSAGCR